MKKRLMAAILICILILGTCAPALGVWVDDSEVLLKQGSRNCTLTSVTMLLRRKAILDGDAGWENITTASVGRVAWSGGLAWNFTYNGVHVTVQRKASGWTNVSLEEKKAYLIEMLEAHPEGIVTHDYDYPHAVLLTGYDAETDTFYCCDPAKNCPKDIIPLSQCIICGSGQDGKLKHIDQLWYADYGVSSGAGTMPVDEADQEREDDPVAWISFQDIEIDGVKTPFQVYVVTDDNANETCYVNVADLAAALSGTAGQFDLCPGQTVSLFSGVAYPYSGSDAWDGFPPIVPAALGDTVTYVDGAVRDLDAIQVTDYNGASHAYYKLRDLGDALGFTVGWEAERGVYVETAAA